MREVPQRLASPSEETPKRKKKKNQISVSITLSNSTHSQGFKEQPCHLYSDVKGIVTLTVWPINNHLWEQNRETSCRPWKLPSSRATGGRPASAQHPACGWPNGNHGQNQTGQDGCRWLARQLTASWCTFCHTVGMKLIGGRYIFWWRIGWSLLSVQSQSSPPLVCSTNHRLVAIRILSTCPDRGLVGDDHNSQVLA